MGAPIIIAILILVGIPLLLILFVIGVYNALVRLRNQVDNAWSQIDVQLKRRHDLIPNLVETAKGYMKHERGTFEAITKARSQAMGANTVNEAAKAEGALGEALSKFMLVVENYPELKANQNFLAVQEELTGFNNKIQMFPSNIIAGMFKFIKRDFFEIEVAAEREVPKVSFS